MMWERMTNKLENSVVRFRDFHRPNLVINNWFRRVEQVLHRLSTLWEVPRYADTTQFGCGI
jgi:hypothetical protein